MKPSAALTLALAASCAAVSGQGVLNFANFGNGIDAPVSDWDGTRKRLGQRSLPTFTGHQA